MRSKSSMHSEQPLLLLHPVSQAPLHESNAWNWKAQKSVKHFDISRVFLKVYINLSNDVRQLLAYIRSKSVIVLQRVPRKLQRKMDRNGQRSKHKSVAWSAFYESR